MLHRLTTQLQRHGAKPFSVVVNVNSAKSSAEAVDDITAYYLGNYNDLPAQSYFENIVAGILKSAHSWDPNSSAAMLFGNDSITYRFETIADETPTNLTEQQEALMSNKELTITITGAARTGKTTASAILAKLLESAGIALEVRSDDMGKTHREMDVMSLVNRLKAIGPKVVINDHVTQCHESISAVLTIPEMAAEVREIEHAEDFLVKISNGVVRSSKEDTPEVTSIVDRLADMGLIIKSMASFNYMISGLGSAVAQYCHVNPVEEDLVSVDTHADMTPEPLYSTARLAFYRIRDDEELRYVFNSYDSADEEDRVHVAELINIGVLTEVNKQLRLTKLGEEVEKFMNDTGFDGWVEQ